MKISVVIPVVKTDDNNEELRYALRSIHKNVNNVKDVWIIGDLPDWIQNVKNIPFSPATSVKWKEKNIRDRFIAACLNPHITSSFLATNDDIFIMKPVDADKYPYYNKGKWMTSVKNHIGVYKKTALHTYNFCVRRGFNTDNVDSHCPIIYEKSKFATALNINDFLTPYGLGVKTVYAVTNRIETTYYPDYKVKPKEAYEDIVNNMVDREFVSCYDGCMNGDFGRFIRETFQEKSIYEI
jgi:hypothetical protein